jgi:hypothetical protein
MLSEAIEDILGRIATNIYNPIKVRYRYIRRIEVNSSMLGN